MKRISESLLFCTALLLVCLAPHIVTAQIAQQCSPSFASSILDANNVRAKIMNNGGLFWNGGSPIYEVPKGGGEHPMFAAGIWLGGIVDGQLRAAATTYGPWEFWAGPYEEVAAGADCNQFDRIYRVERRDMNALETGVEPSGDVIAWPWQYGAPVVDGDGVPGNYNLSGGDRPLLVGDELHYWIMNDIGNQHNNTDTPPMEVEVHGMAFSSASDQNPHYQNTTFYQYRIINKSASTIEDVHLGFFTDVDLGNFDDDYVGSDSLLNLAFTYNADNDDEGHYGKNPPAIGFQVIDSPIGNGSKNLGMTSFAFYNNGGGLIGDPRTGPDFYNYMRGRWKDGEPFTLGGDGRNYSSTPTSFMFSGAAEDGAFWSELNVDDQGTANTPADRRSVGATGPFTLGPGEEESILIAVISGFGDNNLHSLSVVKEAAATYMGLTPETIPTSVGSGLTPSVAPVISNLGDGAVNQPLDFELKWDWFGADVDFEIRLESSDRPVESFLTISPSLLLELQTNTSYAVRVRAATDHAYGPWSEEVEFSTGETSLQGFDVISDFVVTQNAAGPVEPPVGAAADFQGFPGTGRPTSGQQAGEGLWMIHTFDNGSRGSFDAFRQRSITGRASGFREIVGYDLEIRFTAQGSLAWNAFTDGTFLDTPFELWRSPLGTRGDPSDDVRLIPWVVDWDGDGWGIQCSDHSVSGASNDPETDAIYFKLPSDETAGQPGYEAWKAAAISSGDGAQLLGPEVIGRIAFVNWNAGDVGNCQAPFAWNSATPSLTGFNQDIPEEGTIFRIETRLPPAPIPGAPTASDIIPAGPVAFSWSAFSDIATRLEVATEEQFTNVIYGVDNPTSTFTSTQQFAPGTYYWRVFHEAGSPSVPTMFRVTGSPGTQVLPDFMLPVAVRDDVGEVTIEFGMRPGATAGFDEATDQLAPPPPPGGSLDARFTRNGEDFLKDAVSNALETATWQLSFQPGTGRPVITWDPALLPSDGTFRLTDNFDGVIHDVDMRGQNSLVPENGVTGLAISYAASVSVAVDVEAGWNLLGIPLDVPDRAVSTLFPDAFEGTLFSFDGQYVSPLNDAFPEDQGAWLRFPAAQRVELTGLNVGSMVVPLREGWNLVSGPNCLVPATVLEEAGHVLTGTLFGFENGYRSVSVMEPGRGYWLRTSSSGPISMDCGVLAGKTGVTPTRLKGFREIVLRDAASAPQTLFYGGDLPANTHALSYTLPPPSPTGSWVAGFESGRYVAHAGPAGVPLEGASFPVVLSMVVGDNVEPVAVRVLRADGAELSRGELAPGVELVISDRQAFRVVIGSEGSELPNEFAIEGNYPNPFSTASTIRYALPEASDVNLDVFDMLGRRVISLVAGIESAGWHDVQIDGSRFASGSYMIVMRAGGKTRTHRILITR